MASEAPLRRAKAQHAIIATMNRGAIDLSFPPFPSKRLMF